VTQATVAAFLTIIGYSIYDTIIVFDRVRENMVLMRRSTFAQIVNVSLWETIPRSLATTFITLLPVSTLFFFGGETLKDFAFAVLVGIGISAFSTFFIAAPFLAVLKEREPEYKRRMESAKLVTEDSVGLTLREAEQLAADEPAPDLIPDVLQGDGDEDADGEPVPAASSTDSKRERRRQRRSSRPHGRAR
jgi:SecD/SecF fusion protein